MICGEGIVSDADPNFTPYKPEEIISIHDLTVYASQLFRKKFKEDATVFAYAPGRVNLIGEHTDYNEGFVMPMALPMVTLWAGKKKDGLWAEIYSDSKEARREQPKVDVHIKYIEKTGPKWSLYVKGVMAFYKGPLKCFKAVIVSSVPIGGGLSSSASLEVSTYMFLDELNGGEPSATNLEKALVCQKAEHEYAGMPCGIMDQYIAIFAKESNALLIDCRTLGCTHVPFNDPEVVVLITNSNVKHELTGSEYPDRQRQCKQAAKLLNIPYLRDADVLDFNKTLLSKTTDVNILKRARHVISEDIRTEESCKLLQRNGFVRFGLLMNESHISLRDDFQVSCPELDKLVELALSCKGVLGSRMTGGGFGGCTVTLLYKDAVFRVIKKIKKKFRGRPKFYVCRPCDGARRLCTCARWVK